VHLGAGPVPRVFGVSGLRVHVLERHDVRLRRVVEHANPSRDVEADLRCAPEQDVSSFEDFSVYLYLNEEHNMVSLSLE